MTPPKKGGRGVVITPEFIQGLRDAAGRARGEARTKLYAAKMVAAELRACAARLELEADELEASL